IKVPAVVIHGDRDPMMPLEGGKDTAANIPGAELRIIPGIGHDLPTPLINTIADGIAMAASRATAVKATYGARGFSPGCRNAPLKASAYPQSLGLVGLDFLDRAKECRISRGQHQVRRTHDRHEIAAGVPRLGIVQQVAGAVGYSARPVVNHRQSEEI